jgi:hypothetical protein
MLIDREWYARSRTCDAVSSSDQVEEAVVAGALGGINEWMLSAEKELGEMYSSGFTCLMRYLSWSTREARKGGQGKG